MPNIKPISDLRNYTEVLRDVEEGAPVFLTKNGRGRYAIVDMHDYEKAQATIRLMNEIAKGRRSGETEGYISAEGMRAHFCARANEKQDKLHG
jgi:prevent-host-death family protein